MSDKTKKVSGIYYDIPPTKYPYNDTKSHGYLLSDEDIEIINNGAGGSSLPFDDVTIKKINSYFGPHGLWKIIVGATSVREGKVEITGVNTWTFNKDGEVTTSWIMPFSYVYNKKDDGPTKFEERYGNAPHTYDTRYIDFLTDKCNMLHSMPMDNTQLKLDTSNTQYCDILFVVDELDDFISISGRIYPNSDTNNYIGISGVYNVRSNDTSFIPCFRSRTGLIIAQLTFIERVAPTGKKFRLRFFDTNGQPYTGGFSDKNATLKILSMRKSSKYA